MERWKDGKMAKWNNGIMEKWKLKVGLEPYRRTGARGGRIKTPV